MAPVVLEDKAIVYMVNLNHQRGNFYCMITLTG